MSIFDNIFRKKDTTGYAPASVEEWRRVTPAKSAKPSNLVIRSNSGAGARFGVSSMDTPTAVCAGITAVGGAMLIGGTLAAITFTPVPLVCGAVGAAFGLATAMVGSFKGKELLVATIGGAVAGAVTGFVFGPNLTPILGAVAAVGGAISTAVAHNYTR